MTMVAFNPPLSFQDAENLRRAEDFARLSGQVFRRKGGCVGSWSWTRPRLDTLVTIPPGPAGSDIRLGLLKAWMGYRRPLDLLYPWCWPHYVATIDAEPDANPPAVSPKVKLLIGEMP